MIMCEAQRFGLKVHLRAKMLDLGSLRQIHQLKVLLLCPTGKEQGLSIDHIYIHIYEIKIVL